MQEAGLPAFLHTQPLLLAFSSPHWPLSIALLPSSVSVPGAFAGGESSAQKSSMLLTAASLSFRV